MLHIRGGFCVDLVARCTQQRIANEKTYDVRGNDYVFFNENIKFSEDTTRVI